jgi:membrane-associated phospholipid phosphatase
MYLLQVAKLSFFEQLWRTIVSADQWLFIYINRVWTNSFLDTLFPIYRESYTWIPLYFFLLLLVLTNFKWKALPWIFFFILTVALSDQISSAFVKDFFGRLRPCGDPNFSQYVRLLLSRCPLSGSFTSSHASNHFAMTMFMVITLKPYLYKWKWVLWFWAASIAYGQVYIGVHYPLDVIGGALLGCLLGYITAKIFLRRVGALLLPEPGTDPELQKQPQRI